MKNSELLKLRAIYTKELERLMKIKELLNEEKCKELIELSRININEFKEVDNLKILRNILQNFKITQTNGIYVCLGSFVEDDEGFAKVSFNSRTSWFRCYRDIENKEFIRAFTSPEYFNLYGEKILADIFEQNNIVLNLYDSCGYVGDNAFDEVRNEFFMNCINLGQAKSKKLILEKYKRM